MKFPRMICHIFIRLIYVMGIHGLTTFMNKTYLESILEDVKLSNCYLLIDGYSLLHKVHYFNNLQPFYGGNYDKLAVKLNDLFMVFKQCRIEPVFLLDGGRDKADRKFQTSLRRANQRLRDACVNMSSNCDQKKVLSCATLVSSSNFPTLNGLLPICALRVFIDMIKKHGFIHFQCNFEADYELACLGK